MMRNAATTEVRAATKYFEQRIAKESKDNPKAFWKYVKSKTVCQTNVGNLKYNGQMAETDMEKAKMLNLFFSNVYTDEDPTMPDVNTSPADYCICGIRVTPESVKNKLCKLNQNKSAGPHGLHPRILNGQCRPVSN